MPGIEEGTSFRSAWRSPFAIVFYVALLLLNGAIFAFSAADGGWGALGMMMIGAPFANVVLGLVFAIASLLVRRAGIPAPRWYFVAGVGFGALVAVEAAVASLHLHGC